MNNKSQTKSPTKSQRQLQVGEQIKRIIAGIFLQEDIFVIQGSQVTIARADVSPDMKNVRVIINIFGEVDKKKMTKELNEASGFFRSRLAKQITMRVTPEIFFVLDDGGNDAKRTLAILEEESKKFNQ